MGKFKYVKELLQTSIGTEGQLIIPRKIHDTLIDEVDKFLIPRSEAAIFAGPGDVPGSSLDVDFVTPDKMDVRSIAEGAELPLDETEYTSTNYKPIKYGITIKITRELIEDSKWNLLDHNVRIAGRRLAENENSLVITALDTAANTVTGGATVTIANITRAMQHLEDSDFNPTTLLVGMEVLNDLRNIDTFVEADKMGNRDMLARGFTGILYGMNVIRVSSNAGATSTSAYVFDNSEAYIIVEKRPMTVENFDIPTHDLSAVAITQRLTVGSLRTSAVAKITSS